MSTRCATNRALRALLLAGLEPPWLCDHPRRRYLVAVVLATPYWASRAELRRLERTARRVSALRKRPHVLDHIVPLNHPYVCGLNVPENLQILPRETNAAKSNHWCEWHGDLFGHDPEQLGLFLDTLLPA